MSTVEAPRQKARMEKDELPVKFNELKSQESRSQSLHSILDNLSQQLTTIEIVKIP